MGGVIAGKLQKLLSDYTYNYQGKMLSLELLKGQFRVENLLLNDKAINKILAHKKLAFELKFGLMKKFELKLSILGMKLESLTLENLIVVVGPTDYISTKMEGPKEEAELRLLYENYLANLTGQKPNLRSPDKDFYEREIMEYFAMREKSLEQAKPIDVPITTPTNPKLKESNVDPNKKLSAEDFFTIELFNILTNMFDCKVIVKNVVMVFMGNFSQISSEERLDSLITTFIIDNLEFKSEKLERFIDSRGNFKKFINVHSFLKESGAPPNSQSAYWTFQMDNVQVRVSTGNPMFYVDPRLTQSLNNAAVDQLLANFFAFANNDKKQNCFTLYSLAKVSADTILFYLRDASFPIHAAFINMDTGESIVSIERTRLGTLLDVFGYFKSTNYAAKFAFIKPRILPMTRQKKLYYAQRFGVAPGVRQTAFDAVCRNVAKDYISMPIYMTRYQSLIAGGFKPDDAKILVMRSYCLESTIYKLLYGNVLPQQLQSLDENSLFPNLVDKSIVGNQQTLSNLPNQAMMIPQLPAKPVVPLTRKPGILLLNKIHIHFRLSTNLYVNLLRNRTYEREYSIILRDFVMDIMKPLGSLKAKLMINILAFVINFERKFYRINNYSRDGIFGSSGGNSSFSDNIIELQPTTVVACINVQEGIKNQTIQLIDVTVRMGSFIINVYPDVLRNLAAYAFDMLTLSDNRAQTKILKTLAYSPLNDKRLETAAIITLRQALYRKRLSSTLVNNMRTRPMPKIDKVQIQKEISSRRSVPTIKGQEDPSKLVRKALLNENAKRQIEKVNDLLKKLSLHVDIKTQPFVLNMHDENFKQGLSIKYLSSEIFCEVDMALKQMLNIKAFNVEISSREALPVLIMIAEKLKSTVDDIQAMKKK